MLPIIIRYLLAHDGRASELRMWSACRVVSVPVAIVDLLQSPVYDSERPLNRERPIVSGLGVASVVSVPLADICTARRSDMVKVWFLG